jgi:hypothetical protein
MAKSRKGHRKSGKHSRKTHKRRHHSRKHRGGQAPVNYSNPGPMNLNLAQGQQFAAYHKDQHGGMAAYNYGPYPAAVQEASVLPGDLVASAKLLPLDQAFAEIRQFGPSSDNPNLAGGRRRKAKKSKKSRKSRKTRKVRKQRGGLYRWGGGRGSCGFKGGAYSEMRFPMPVGDEAKMLIPAKLQEQAGLNPEWNLIKDPMAFAPITK